jgi:hypothetical protein
MPMRKKKEVRKMEEVGGLRYLGHPTCRLKYFVELRTKNPELSVEEAMKQAEELCLKEGKLHPTAKLARKAEELGYPFVKKSRSE